MAGVVIWLSVGSTGVSAELRDCQPTATRRGSGLRPVILYTDLLSGPISGGEGGMGIYLSIFGRNFGRSFSAKTEKDVRHARVYLGGHEVANYRYAGGSAGRPDMEQITVQVGHLGGAVPGRPLRIEIEANGLRSNANLTFTPNPGKIYFVDNVRGEDATGAAGEIARPFRTVQTGDPKGGVWPRVGPGDVVVMRGTAVPWQGSGRDGYFLRFQDSGTAPRGRLGSGPITLMGYPGEDVFINETREASSKGAIAARSASPGKSAGEKVVDTDPNVCDQNKRLLCSQWVVLADLRVEGGGKDGAVDLETGANHWRVVNNTLSATTADASARSGGIAGDGVDVVLLGNTVRDINSPDPGLRNHGIYIDGPGSYRIDYNYIHDVTDGSGFQVYGDQTATGSFLTDNLSFRHNWVDHVAKYCINFADNSGRGFSASDNVLAYCGMAGLRINSSLLRGARVHHNTFYEADSMAGDRYGAIVIDSVLGRHALDVRDNIFVPHRNMPYMGGDAALTHPTHAALFAGNLYFGGSGTTGFDRRPILAEPGFVDQGSCNLRLAVGSEKISARSPGAGW